MLRAVVPIARRVVGMPRDQPTEIQQRAIGSVLDEREPEVDEGRAAVVVAEEAASVARHGAAPPSSSLLPTAPAILSQ